MIELKNVSKVFGKKSNEFVALSDINFDIKDGESVAIVGKSGSGKSTLMHVMSGLDHATSGEVLINGKDLRKLKSKEIDHFRASQMSFIFQAFFVEANQSCLDNVSLPLEITKFRKNARRQKALEALEAVELSEKANVKAMNLSGGQKQRLAIARAIVNKPKIIFADEPTGNLDSATGEKVTKLLFDINKSIGSTLIIVTHDLDLARQCERQIYIKDGRIDSITARKKAGKS